jgi:ribosome-associated protein
MIPITPQIVIGEDELEFKFVRASGPGGQNVNKVASAVQLRFDVAGSPSLEMPVRQRLARLAGRRLTLEGVLVIDARRFRSQERNRQDAIERLAALIRRAAEPPRPRLKTRPSRAKVERRLEAKHRRAQIKRGRRSSPQMDE